MDINDLASSSITSLNLLHPVSEVELEGIFINGYTPDSKEWKKIEKQIVGTSKKQSIIFEKGKQKMELDSDGMEKRNKILKSVITSIDGLTKNGEPLELNEGVNISNFLDDPAYEWMLEQWASHLDDRKHFFDQSEKVVTSGSDASAG